MIDLTQVLYDERKKPRGDELEPHASDIHGCDRATWYRRHGLKPIPFTAEKLALFDQGHAYEAAVRARLIAAGHDIFPSKVTVFGLTGHSDFTWPALKAVVDAKFSFNAPIKGFASPHYIVATAAYTMAEGWTAGAIIHGNGRSGVGVIETQYDFDVEEVAHDTKGEPFGPKSMWHGLTWAEIVEERAREIHLFTGKGAVMPPADPGELSPWGCRYCDWAQCERNPKHDPDAAIPE